MKISRYLTVADFCKEASDLKIYDWSINANTLERLERQRSLVPRLRIRYPDEIVRRWLAEDNPKYPVTYPVEPDGQRWEDANAFERARDRGWPHIFYDPRTVPCVLDNPEIRFLPFIENPSEKPFIPWKNYKIYLSDSETRGYMPRDAAPTYYSSWQLLQFAEVVNMGVTCFMNLFGIRSWPSDEDILAAPRALNMTLGALTNFEKHSNALDAIVWFIEEFEQGYSSIITRTGSRRILTDTEVAEISEIENWAANAASEHYRIDLNMLTEAIKFLCERWREWNDLGRPLIANAYKIFAGQGIKLATIKNGLTLDDFSAQLGCFRSGFRTPIIKIMWPNWEKVQRESAYDTLKSYKEEYEKENKGKDKDEGEKCDKPLAADFSEDLIHRFLDFIEANELHGFYWRLESFNNHAFNGNDYTNSHCSEPICPFSDTD